MMSQLRVLVDRRNRGTRCRRQGHAWTDMAYPPACLHCGRTQPVTSSPPLAA